MLNQGAWESLSLLETWRFVISRHAERISDNQVSTAWTIILAFEGKKTLTKRRMEDRSTKSSRALGASHVTVKRRLRDAATCIPRAPAEAAVMRTS